MFKILNPGFKLRTCINRLSSVGYNQKVIMQRTIEKEDVKLFSKVTGDYNSVHLNTDDKPGLVHGALLNGLVSGVIGTKLPGPGTLLVSQEMKFPNACFIGDKVTITVELVSLRKIAECKFEVINSDGKPVLVGSAKLRVAES